MILREYARRGRVTLAFVEPDAEGRFAADGRARRASAPGADLVVVSQVMFQTGQVMPELPQIVAAAHAAGARVLLDVYHSLGVFPVDLEALDVDFAVGGSYKYLRGGPGACFLYRRTATSRCRGSATLDIGWFAKESPFAYARPDPPRFAAGGDAWLESTPAVLPLYQARAGQAFAQAVGVARLRAYSLEMQRRLVALLAERGIAAQRRNGGPRRVRHRAHARRRRWAAALERARHRHGCPRRVAAPVPGRADDRCELDRGRARSPKSSLARSVESRVS